MLVHLSSLVGNGGGVTTASMLFRLVKLPVLTFLATIGFLTAPYVLSSPIDQEHHQHHHHQRWRQTHHRLAPENPAAANRDLRAFQSLELCSRCPPGFGVARRCTLVQDTVCHSCPPGYYAPTYSRKHACWPCSRCGDGLYEAHPCTGTSDAICDACLNQPPGLHPCYNTAQQGSNLLSSAPVNSSSSSQAISDIHHISTSTTEDPNSSFHSESNDEEVALGVAQLAAFQLVLILTAVAAILALTCRLRVFSSHEPTRLKMMESLKDDGVALVEHLSES